MEINKDSLNYKPVGSKRVLNVLSNDESTLEENNIENSKRSRPRKPLNPRKIQKNSPIRENRVNSRSGFVSNASGGAITSKSVKKSGSPSHHKPVTKPHPQHQKTEQKQEEGKNNLADTPKRRSSPSTTLRNSPSAQGGVVATRPKEVEDSSNKELSSKSTSNGVSSTTNSKSLYAYFAHKNETNSNNSSENENMILSLKMMIEDQKHTIEELSKRNEELEKTLNTKVERMKKLEFEQKSIYDSFLNYRNKVKDKFINLFRDCTRWEKAAEEQNLIREKYEIGIYEEFKIWYQKFMEKIGTIITQRDGHLLSDYWEDGQNFASLHRKLDELRKEKEELEKLRKKSRRSSRNKPEESNGEIEKDSEFKKPEPVKVDSLVDEDDIAKFRLGMIKKEISDLVREEEDLESKKKRLLSRIKIFNEEKKSRFDGCPILNEKYLLIRLLGKGGFSEVFKAFDLVDLKYVACKIHQLNNHWTDERKKNYTRHATREYNIHKSLDHPRVVKLYDVFAIDLNAFCTVLEYCEGEDLDIYLKFRKQLPEREARIIMAQVFSGLKYLNQQKQKIIHYDLKPGNILFHKGQVKITDFGLSKIMTEDHEEGIENTSIGAGTYYYLPPECLDMSGNARPLINSKVDVWSAGIVFYQMLYGKRPFGEGMSQDTLIDKQIVQNIQKVEFPAKPPVSNATKELISKCLSPRVADRPSILEIAQSPYFLKK